MLKSLFSFTLLSTFLFSCTPTTQNSLLSIGGEGSSTSGSENQTSIAGLPSINTDAIITPDGKVLASGIENGDLLEVSGKCSDLGNKKNRILFQVFENTNENGFPLIDNSIDWKCQASTATTELSSGNETCFIPTMGIGVVEDNDPPIITPQYPQCFNGRFSFFIRLGRAMRNDPLSSDFDDVTNPRVSYRLKLKLRVLGQGTQVTDSPGWDTITVNRVVSKPTAKLTLTNFTHKIELDVAKFSNIKYNAFYSAAGPSYIAGNSVSGPLLSNCTITTVSGTGANSTSCSFIHSSLNVATTAGEFNHAGLVPGVSYAYQFMAEDLNYVYPSVSGTETSGYSLAIGNIMPQTYIEGKTPLTAPIRCTFSLVNRSSASPVQWAYKVNDPGWMVSSPTAGMTIDAACSSYSDTCTVSGGGAGTQRHYAVRSFGDTNGNGVLNVGELVSDWSPPDYATKTNVCEF